MQFLAGRSPRVFLVESYGTECLGVPSLGRRGEGFPSPGPRRRAQAHA